MSRMSRTKMEILSTYLRIQFIIMTLAAKYVHVIEAPQPAQIRPNVTSSLKFLARSSRLHPREYVVQHAVSSCLHPRENIGQNALISFLYPGTMKKKGHDGQMVRALESGSGAVQIRSLDRFLLCALAVETP